MTGATSPTPTDAIRYPSLAALQAAHNDLLRRQRDVGNTPELLAAVTNFLHDGAATGGLLDGSDDRRAAQTLLDYWATRLYRVGAEPPDTTLAEFDPRLAPELPDKLCPYLGLDAFREDDYEKFFGRNELIARLVERLGDHRLLAVVGPSGSGKSSLVRAGLIPTLKSGALPGSAGWHYLPPIVPGSDPMAALRRVLPDQVSERGGEWATVTPSPAHPVTPSPRLLVVDQFEELFTLCDDDQARRAFAAALREFIDASDAENRLILTMRSDFETFVARAPDLQARFNQSRVQVTPLSAAELREAIEQPAEAVGLKFQRGIVDALLQDILGEPAGLPLLQFTLLKLWENRDHNRVTREIYEQVGGGRLALARSADEFYDNLIPEEKVTARRILLRIVRPGEGLEITSSRIRREDLYSGGEDPSRIDRVLDKLIAAHLIRLTEGETSEDAQIEVAHEALVRNWPTLVDWLEQEKVALATRRRLEGRAAEWVRLGQGSGGLLDEVELREAERGLASTEAQYLGYEPILPTFVEASRVAINQAAQEKEIARENKLRSARRYMIVLGILAVLAVFATGIALRLWSVAQQQRDNAQRAAINAQQQRDDAQRAAINAQQQRATAETAKSETKMQLDIAESQKLAYEARTQLDENLEMARLLAYEAVSLNDNGISEQVLRDALEQTPGVSTLLRGKNDPTLTSSKSHIGRVFSAVFSLDGQRFLTPFYGSARLWNASGELLATLQENTNISLVQSVAFSPDGQRIVTASTDGSAQFWNPKGQLLATFQYNTIPLNGATFSPDGRHVLTASIDGSARLWNENGVIVAFSGHTDWINSAVFSPNGQQILTSSGDKTARLWAVNGKLKMTFQGHTGQIYNAVFSSDGRRILTSSADNTSRLWDINGRPLAILQGHTDAVTSEIFNSNDQYILTASDDGTARLWDLSAKELISFQGHTDAVTSAVFSPDAKRILTASADKTARLWDLSGQQIAILSGHTDAVTSAVFSPDGKRIVTTSYDGTAREYIANTEDLLAIAACLVDRGLTDEEIQRFQVPRPLKFDFTHRPPCATILGEQK